MDLSASSARKRLDALERIHGHTSSEVAAQVAHGRLVDGVPRDVAARWARLARWYDVVSDEHYDPDAEEAVAQAIAVAWNGRDAWGELRDYERVRYRYAARAVLGALYQHPIVARMREEIETLANDHGEPPLVRLDSIVRAGRRYSTRVVAHILPAA